MNLPPNVNILSDVAHQSCIQSPVKHLTWCYFRK